MILFFRWRRKNQRRKQKNKRMWTNRVLYPVHQYPGRHGNHLYPHSPHRDSDFWKILYPFLSWYFVITLCYFDLSLFMLKGVWYGQEMGEFSSTTRVSVLPCGKNLKNWLDGLTWIRWYRDPQTTTRVHISYCSYRFYNLCRCTMLLTWLSSVCLGAVKEEEEPPAKKSK